jgi:hypothetical protein
MSHDSSAGDPSDEESLQDQAGQQPPDGGETKLDPKVAMSERQSTGALKGNLPGLIGVVVGAVITGGISLWAHTITVDATESQSTREDKSKVYFDYLEAANDFDTGLEEHRNENWR